MEANRLNWFKEHQSDIRAEDYDVLAAYVNNVAVDETVPGRKVILPSTFSGGPRNMQQNYLDAMAMVQKYGRPDLFITFTCNPNWREIKENLLAQQQPCNRPDLVARVFNMKLKALISDLKERHIFGRVRGMVHVIEFQKRGLPHAHILVILIPDDKAWEREKIDKIVCAELPNRDAHPRLFEIVKRCMLHGPCGALNPKAPCMENNKCTKDFPKDFCKETQVNSNGYPKYERKDDGKYVLIGKNKVDNRWVVPYCPFLSLKYNAHINVEICTSIKSVKYIFKYVYKGHDCANLQFSKVLNAENQQVDWDEVKWYLDTRYVSAPEACWRLREYNMHLQTHHIERLPVHLEGKHSVCFKPGEEQTAVASNGAKSKLLAWFTLNQSDPAAKEFSYIEVPEHYTWHKKENVWKTRKRGFGTTIGRMYMVSPTDREKYFLRILLLHVKGAKTFADLRTYETVIYDSFQDACKARGLLDDDREWDTCLSEAESFQMPMQLRQLFAIICVMCEPSDPAGLFERHKEHMMQDYEHRFPVGETALHTTLNDIEEVLATHRKTLADFKLPEIPAGIFPCGIVVDEHYDLIEQRTKYKEQYDSLNPEQKYAFDKIVQAIENEDSSKRCFFVYGPGGSGKTFLYNTLMYYLRSESAVVLPCAFTGIAATLLSGGRTSHNRFQLPVPLTDTATSNIRLGSKTANVLKQASLIIWDEATMAPTYAVNAVDTLLREIMGDTESIPMVPSDKPFGGKVVVLGGDFRQTLPVVPHGNKSQILEICIKNSKCWKAVEIISLNKNMRADDAPPLASSGSVEWRDFSDWLLNLGDGVLQEPGLEENTFEIPPICVIKDSIVDAVFPQVILPKDIERIASRAILTPKNEDALQISEDVLQRIQAESVTYFSLDSIQQDSANEEENNNYPLEFLNSLTPGGMPPHKLNLKVGAVVILLRNLDAKHALCNGTRLVVRQMMSRVIDAEVLTGAASGKRVFIPRTVLAPSNPDLPFILKRKQFPIRLAFGMTINKSQGQTLDLVGIYLPSPVFSHGQLYVACSRTKSFRQLKIKVLPTDSQGNLKKDDRVFTKNIVYKEVFCN